MKTMKAALDVRADGAMAATLVPLAAFDPFGEPLPEALAQRLDAARRDSAAICLQVKGNQHTVYGLLRTSPEFDVVIRREPDLALIPGAQIIPEGAFAAFFERSLLGLRQMLEHLAAKPAVPVLVMGPPPPVEDAEYLARNLEAYFRGQLGDPNEAGRPDTIADPLVRWKVWSILNAVYESIAVKHGAVWLPVPEEAFHERRFLHPKAWGSTATHANAWFGELRLRQIEGAVA